MPALAAFWERPHRKWMLVALSLLGAVIAGVALIASAIAAVCRLLTGSSVLALTLGTVTLPALICMGFFYWLKTMQADDAAPGAVLIGNLAALAVVTPVALIASHLTLRAIARRATRNDS